MLTSKVTHYSMSQELTLKAALSGEHEKKSDWINICCHYFVRSRCGRNLGKTIENQDDCVCSRYRKPIKVELFSLHRIWRLSLTSQSPEVRGEDTTQQRFRAVNKDIYLILLRKSAKKTRITESSSFFIGYDVMQPWLEKIRAMTHISKQDKTREIS